MRCAPTRACRRPTSAPCWPISRQRGTDMTTMLQLKDLHAYYGKSHVLHGVNLDVKPGEIVALLGRNGSGRSTTVKSIMGLVECTGSVRWRDQEILGQKAFQIAHAGIGYVPENRDIF